MSITLITVAGIFTIASIWKPNVLLSLIASIGWLGVLTLVILSPSALLPAGSNSQGIVIFILAGGALGIFMNGLMHNNRERKERQAEINFYTTGQNGSPKSFTAFMRAKEIQDNPEGETTEEYRARVHKKLHPQRRA